MSKFLTAEVMVAITVQAGHCETATTGGESRYQMVADALQGAFNEGADTDVHLIGVASQDACTTGPAWAVFARGLRDALKRRGLAFEATRNKASGKGAFVLTTLQAVKAKKAAQAADQQGLAEKADAERQAALQAAESSITEIDLVNGLISETKRLGLSLEVVASELIAALNLTIPAARQPRKRQAAKVA